MVPYLPELAQIGFVAVSFDPFQHCVWRLEIPQAPRIRVTGNERRGLSRTLHRMATLDWLRPRSPARSGEPNDLACQAAIPLPHRGRCRPAPSIPLEGSADDRQMPPARSQRFARQSADTDKEHPRQMRVSLHAGMARRCIPETWVNIKARFQTRLAIAGADS